jgi:hypothetical protein
MKRGLRITLILAFGLPLGFILVIGLIAFADGNFGAAATDYYEGGRGYAVYRPEGNPDNAPAVLLVHEWWGLNEEHLVKARRLADEGYVVYSPDAYGGKLAKGVPGALFLTFTQDIEDIHGRIDRAYNAMLNDPMVDPDRTAVAGFCFGGRQAMMLGIRDSRPRSHGDLLRQRIGNQPGSHGPAWATTVRFWAFSARMTRVFRWTKWRRSAAPWRAGEPTIARRFILASVMRS